MRNITIIVDPNVGAFDQGKQEAIDALRRADSFMLFVPDESGADVTGFSCASERFMALCLLGFLRLKALSDHALGEEGEANA